MLRDARIVAVPVRVGDDRRSLALSALHCVPTGQVVVAIQPRPPGKQNRVQPVCDALLTSLGKTNELGGSQRNTQEQLRDVTGWLLAENVSHLIALDCHHINAGGWQKLIEVAVDVDATLYVGCDNSRLGRGHKELLSGYGGHWRDPEAVVAELAGNVTADEPLDDDWPPTPETHFMLFADDLRQLLRGPGRERAEAEYTEAADRTHAW